ncbi:hypothetical protein GQ42DRAFT_161134 [Ramicandelaber brevisporus]|nr:hypothetical protein GQ42DRAFT_161134 [Ramicandelaber brevisporus]
MIATSSSSGTTATVTATAAATDTGNIDSVDGSTASSAVCESVSLFKDTLRLLRKNDDNVMLQINKTNTHSRAACLDFFNLLTAQYTQRDALIGKCSEYWKRRAGAAQRKSDEYPEDAQLKAQAYLERIEARWIQNEHGVEEIIRTRTLKVLREKCRIPDLGA